MYFMSQILRKDNFNHVGSLYNVSNKTNDKMFHTGHLNHMSQF